MERSFLRKGCTVARRSDEEKKVLSEVLPNVAAQMRGPLSVLHATVQKMMHENVAGADRLNRSCFQLMRLAGNLTAAEYLAEDPYLHDMYNYDIVDLCRTICEKAAPAAEKSGVTVQFECKKAEHSIVCNRSMISRMLLNLLSNAIKFNREGGRVVVSLQVQKTDVLLSVQDTGCGISEEKMETLFDRYLHSECLDPLPHGFGLGLPLCQMIVRAHGGRLVAESQEGKGTRVTVALPNERTLLQQVHDPAFDYAGGFDPVLLELSDALSCESFQK